MWESFLTRIATFTTLSAVVVSVMDNLGYWRVFGIDIFGFMTISELMMLSIKPLSIFIFSAAFGSLIIAYLATYIPKGFGLYRDEKTKHFTQAISTSISSDQVEKSKRSRRAYSLTLRIIAITLMLAFIYVCYITGSTKFLFVPIATLLAMHITVENNFTLNLKIKKFELAAVVGLMISICGVSFVSGNDRAIRITTGVRYMSLGTEPCDSRFVGTAAEYLVFFEPKNDGVTFKKRDDLKKMTLFKQHDQICKKIDMTQD